MQFAEVARCNVNNMSMQLFVANHAFLDVNASGPPKGVLQEPIIL